MKMKLELKKNIVLYHVKLERAIAGSVTVDKLLSKEKKMRRTV